MIGKIPCACPDCNFRIREKENEIEELCEALGNVLDTLPNPLTWKNEDMDKINRARETLSKIEGGK